LELYHTYIICQRESDHGRCGLMEHYFLPTIVFNLWRRRIRVEMYQEFKSERTLHRYVKHVHCRIRGTPWCNKVEHARHGAIEKQNGDAFHHSLVRVEWSKIMDTNIYREIEGKGKRKEGV
jgi:hypothetical protein